MKKRLSNRLSSSFRDPNGFLFYQKGVLYRQINKSAKRDFDLLLSSGLYKKLVQKKLLVPHRQVSSKKAQGKNFYKLIKPKLIPFVSYPYEWSFSQLKDAALVTLEIQKIALRFGMSLKDASAYNIQFVGFRPVFIDTLSFEKYKEGRPWVAYRQFCQHFLAPLALMAEKDLRLNLLLRDFIDGIPLDLASKLLPAKTKFNFSLLGHIHLHALNQKRMADKKVDKKRLKMGRSQMISLLNNLETAVKSLKIKKAKTEWEKYYTFTNYSKKAFNQKREILKLFLKKISPESVVDLGANTGVFSRETSGREIFTIAADIDPLAVEKAYIQAKKDKDENLLPLVINLISPSPGLGWANKERDSFEGRVKTDCVIAFALVHHLAISNNLPFLLIADYFSRLGNWLIIEFVPKSDSKVQVLLQNREDIFKNYSQENFEKEFSKFFQILEKKKIKDSKRVIYLMKKK